MSIATTPYLNLRCRSLSEAERDREIRDSERSGGRNGDERTECMDSLSYLIDRTRQLQSEVAVRNGKSLGQVRIQYAADHIEDALRELEARLEELQEQRDD